MYLYINMFINDFFLCWFAKNGTFSRKLKKVLERRLRRMLKVDEMHFDFMPCKGTIDVVFILRRLQEEYLDKEKILYLCFVDLEKAFNRVPRKYWSGQ